MVAFNSGYLKTNRGVIKIVQIVIGFIICAILCANWYGGRSCFGDGRLGFASGLNFVILIINIVFLLLNLFSLNIIKVEKLYSIIACILFLIASILLIWYLIEYEVGRVWLIVAIVLIIVLFLLFLWDVKILMGEASN